MSAPPAAPVALPAADAPARADQAHQPVPVAPNPALGASSSPPPPVAPLPAPGAVAPAAPVASLDAAALTAALHAQYLQHQLALAEQRNQHLLEQQQLMQQMLDLLRRPA
ncbi:hypothetical protein JAO77_05215 [Hymenobacter sp. BT559]|nr:hypothetical protein [Hymenobacter sp. BT559]